MCSAHCIAAAGILSRASSLVVLLLARAGRTTTCSTSSVRAGQPAAVPEWLERHTCTSPAHCAHCCPAVGVDGADYNLFTPGKPLADNTLWVLQQMPGPYIVASDHTEWLRNSSYWASYNRIADPFLFQLTNQSALVAAYGPHFSWSNTSRALIFAREHATVVDEQSLQKLIRYNHFETDPVSTQVSARAGTGRAAAAVAAGTQRGVGAAVLAAVADMPHALHSCTLQGCAAGARSASNAIAERGDLTSPSAVCCPGLNFQDELSIDGKYTTAAMMRSGKLQSMIQSGPTFDTQPVFVWSNSTVRHLSHAGQPEVWNFPWVLASWNLA